MGGWVLVKKKGLSTKLIAYSNVAKHSLVVFSNYCKLSCSN